VTICCEMCRTMNPVAKQMKDLLEKRTLAKRQYELKKSNEEKEAKIAYLEARNQELNAIIGQHEAQKHATLKESHDFNDGMDDVLCQTGLWSSFIILQIIKLFLVKGIFNL